MNNDKRPLRVAVDVSQLDSLHASGAGQFRYLSDLLRGFSEIESEFQFLVIGSYPAPVPGLHEILAANPAFAKYRQLRPPLHHRLRHLDHFRYASLLLGERVDLLHTLHTFVPLIAPCPIVITIYDLMFEIFPEYRAATQTREHRLYKWSTQRKVQRAICISETSATDLHRLWGIDRDAVDVVHLGTDLTTWRSQHQEHGLVRADDQIVSPYNLEPRKNLETLVKAFAQLCESGRDLRLILFGRSAVTDEREAHFEQTISDLGIAQRVIRTGIVPDDELSKLYREATVFVFPSLYEGFGLPVLEAMASGACVVARSASAMSEVLGDAGRSTETSDMSRLSDAIGALLDDPGERQRIGRAAIARADSFTIARMAELTLDSYRTALEKRRR